MPRRVRVRRALRIVEQDGWVLARTRGSHRQYRHPAKPGTVTIPGHMNDQLHPKTWKSILKRAGLEQEPL